MLRQFRESYSELGDINSAINYYERALIVAKELNDRQGAAAIIGNLGVAYGKLGHNNKAINCHQ